MIELPEEMYIHQMVDGRMITICTLKQIVCHAIGLDYFRKKPYKRHGNLYFRPYRNYFCTTPDDKNWTLLEKEGYAEHGEISKCGLCSFKLTRKGLDWLGEQIGVHIWNESR